MKKISDIINALKEIPEDAEGEIRVSIEVVLVEKLEPEKLIKETPEYGR